MEFRGVIRGFGNYTKPQLELMKQDLSIEMSLPTLEYCASYYRRQKRDPGIEELRMLDRFSATLVSSPASVATVELISKDNFAAETYADLLNKRSALLPNAHSTPCTPEEAAHVATAYLARAGKSMGQNGFLTVAEDRAQCFASVSEDHCVVYPHAQTQLRFLPASTQGKQAGDWLVLLMSAVPQSSGQYETAVGNLLKCNNLSGCISDLRIVGDRGLLYEVLSMTKGVWLELSRLSRVQEPVPLKLLTEGYLGDRLLRISAESADTLIRLAKELGIRACVFGKVLDQDKVRITNEKMPEILLDHSFVTSLFPIKGACAKLPEEGSALPSVLHTSDHSKARYLYNKVPGLTDGIQIDTTVTAAATARTNGSFFRNALYASLTPVLTLAAAGCDYAQQTTSVCYRFPKAMADADIMGACMASVLGVYRAHAELGIPSTVISVLYDATLQVPETTVFSTAVGNTCPNRFMQDGNRVYLMQIELQSNGLPGFATLRKDLAFLTDLRKRGILKSARVLCGESLTDGLKAMERSGLTCRIRNTKLLSQEQQTLAILLETGAGIPAIPVGGVVTEKISDENEPKLPSLPPRKPSLIWSENPEIVILSAVKDTEAQELAAALLKKGSNVHCFSTAPAESDALSRAILGAGTLILCGDIRLPQTPQVNFALETMRQGGGYVIAVGTEQNEDAEITFPMGLSEAHLKEICRI